MEHRSQASLLTQKELDLVLLGSILTTVLERDSIVDGRNKPAKRRKVLSCHMHHGFTVCKTTYAFLYNIGTKHRLENITKHYLEHGMDTRVHKNSRQLPPRALSLNFAENSSLVKFIENYAEQNAILLPGRIRGYKRDDLKLLPSSRSKKVHRHLHITHMSINFKAAVIRGAAYTTFCCYWRELLLHVIITKPRSDLCWVC